MQRLQFAGSRGEKCSRARKRAAIAQHGSRAECQAQYRHAGDGLPGSQVIQLQIDRVFDREGWTRAGIQLNVMQFQPVGVSRRVTVQVVSAATGAGKVPQPDGDGSVLRQ